jgi:hypothetical protein
MLQVHISTYRRAFSPFQIAMQARSSMQDKSMWIYKNRCVPLALIGWYLMTAPFVGPATHRQIDTNAPLTQWQILMPFESLTECQDRLSSYAKQIIFVRLSEQVPGPQDNVTDTLRCISSDDTRLNFGRALADPVGPSDEEHLLVHGK